MNPIKLIANIRIPFTGNAGATLDTSKPATPWNPPPTPAPTAIQENSMATLAPVPDIVAVAQPPQATVVKKQSFLQHLGSILKNILHIGEEVATVAEPIIAVSFPEVLPLYKSALGLAAGAEAMAPALTGTGPQKLAQLLQGLTPEVLAWAKQNNINWPEAEIQKWASAVVDTINLIPAPTSQP